MAAIGALFERDQQQSQELFENAKAMIKIYLEERRKENVKRADFRLTPVSEQSTQPQESSGATPLWLVQAMLLNIIYGHNSADKAIGESSYNHCNALVSLARAANLLGPTSTGLKNGQDSTMGGISSWGGKGQSELDEKGDWLRWKVAEERKRTLFVIYIVQSLLISAYNHQPVLTHSEISLDLPCDEAFFSAESATVFGSLGGIAGAKANQTGFRAALEYLMGASKRLEQHQQLRMNPNFGLLGTPIRETLSLSTFGCLVMIHALHNSLWEQRQVHYNKTWTNEETENLHRIMEPALQAWRAAYDRHPNHGPQRPSPFGPLAADCIPLFDLAYLRLFVNLGRSKEFFWARDWHGLANELRCGSEIVQHADNNSSRVGMDGSSSTSPDSQVQNSGYLDPSAAQTTSESVGQSQTDNKSISRRERQLRKAAFCAAESLLNASRLGVTFADFTNHELSLTAALSTFDCAQVLAEWVATLQDRTGPYLGILGQTDVDFSQLPAVMFLEEEDVKLIQKIEEIVGTARTKLRNDTILVNAMDHRLQEHVGFAAQILAVHSLMFERASVWPVTRLMARCLESHAENMKMRSERVLRRE